MAAPSDETLRFTLASECLCVHRRRHLWRSCCDVRQVGIAGKDRAATAWRLRRLDAVRTGVGLL